MGTTMRVSHVFDADVATVFALMSDPGFLERKYDALGARDIRVESVDDRDGAPRIVTRRTVTVDLPGFAKKVMQPTNALVQTDDWAPEAADGSRVCTYLVELQGVPSRIQGTVTLRGEHGRTRQDVEARVTVSVPLLGGRLERFAVGNAERQLQEEADVTTGELATGRDGG